MVPYPPKRTGGMIVVAIAGVGPRGTVHGSTPPVHAPLSRADSTVVQLAGFPGGRPARTRSGS